VRTHYPELDALTRHFRTFADMLTGRQGKRLPDWLDAVRRNDLPSLHALAAGIDFVPALEQFLGSSPGLSPATVTRLTAQWQADHQAFGERDLSDSDYVYICADAIHLRIRLPAQARW
jgi:hypothetical protein